MAPWPPVARARGTPLTRQDDFDFVFSVGVPHPFVFGFGKGGSLSSSFPLVHSLIHRIDRHQSTIPVHVERPTTPRPLPRMPYQFPLHWIRVHIVQFFFLLFRTPHVEVIKSLLPEAPQAARLVRERQRQLPFAAAPFLSAHRLRHPLLQHLHYFGRRPFLRFAHQQMHVFRHQDIAYEQESVSFPHLSHHLHKKISRSNGPQVRPPFVTTEGNEMQIAFSVMSSQISRHEKKRTAHPFFQKGWGALRL